MKKQSPYNIIFQNDQFIAVSKASGISVGGERWDDSAQRLDKLIEHELKLAKLFTVHRIDKETSGLVIFAKDRETHKKLSMAFEKREVSKRYIAIIHGRPSWKETVCNLALVPNGNKRHMTIIDKFKGKESITRFVCKTSAGNYSVLEVFPETGRIHQIRVHTAALGHPVVCDSLYGKDTPVKLSSFKKRYKGDPFDEKPLLSRLGLHALELTLSGMETLTAPIPRDISALLKQIEKVSGKPCLE